MTGSNTTNFTGSTRYRRPPKRTCKGETEETKNALIEAMHTPWVRFAKTGEPDPENWPKYDGYNSEIRIFDRKTTTKLVRRKELMDVWGELRFYED